MIHSRLLQFSENAKLYKFSIFMDRLINDISYIFTDMLFRILIQLIRVDRLSIFKDNVGLSDLLEKLSFKKFSQVLFMEIGTMAQPVLVATLNAPSLKREKRKFFSAISCTLREDTDRNPLFRYIRWLSGSS